MPVSDYTPTVADVGAILRARTKTAGGAEAGTFNPAIAVGTATETRPTAEQVTSLIEDVIADVQSEFGADIPDAPGADLDLYRSSVRRLSALGTALLIELTYFPEQVATGRSPYAQMKTLYDDRFKRLSSAISPKGDADPETAGFQEAMPSAGGFPTTGIGMEQAW